MEKTISAPKEIPLKYCLYARKSSESDEKQALSIGSQITEMQRLAEKQTLNVVETIQESKSAKDSGQRAGFTQLLAGLEEGRFNAILTWAPDRLSRNAGDLGKLVDMMDQKVLVQIRTSGQTLTNTPDEKFLLMILCSQAKLENDNRSKNVKRGQRTRCEMGVRPGPVPLGYKLIRGQKYGEPSKIIIDKDQAPFVKKAFEYIAYENLSGRQVKEYLEDEGFRNKQGKVIGYSRIFKIIKEPFYYGEFDYGGIRYKGTHKPIITKGLFDLVQDELQKYAVREKWGRKDFYFNRILKCAECGSEVSGTEHTNRHGKKYIYYKCNKYGGTKKCSCKYIREETLFKEVANIIVDVKEEHLRMNRRIEEDLRMINRHHKENPITIQEHLISILEDGTKKEKSDILRSFKERLLLKNGDIILV